MAEAAPVVVPVVRPNLTCRFYEERFPQLHEAVNTNVTSIGDMGAYVKLLEYNNVDGKLLLFLRVVQSQAILFLKSMSENVGSDKKRL